MGCDITLSNLVGIIRKCQGFAETDVITEAAQLERDLGITGDDGCELLKAIEKEFDISFAGSDGTIREALGLSDGEYLFHSEGMGLFRLVAALFGRDVEKIKPITVGQLYDAVSMLKTRGRDAYLQL